MERIRRILRTKFVQFFCTRPLVAFIGLMMALQGRSKGRLNRDELPTWTVNSLVVVSVAAGLIGLWVLLAPAPHLNFRKWMGWSLIAYWGTRGVGSLVHAANESSGILGFIDDLGGFYAWTLVGVLGLAMIVAPNPYHLWDESYGPKQSKRRRNL